MQIQSMSGNQPSRTVRSELRPSQALRQHFLGLSRRVCEWAQNRPRPVCLGILGQRRRIGTSTVAFNLADALAAGTAADVLLVEAHFGFPYATGRQAALGFSELLTAERELDSCRLETSRSNLWILPAGLVPAHRALELPLESLNALRNEPLSPFEFVVFDLPPIGRLNASRPLASQMDGLIVVSDSRGPNHQDLGWFRRDLAGTAVEFLGAVKNRPRSG